MTFDFRMGADGKQWDFLKVDNRARARKLIAPDKPHIVIGSPPCMEHSLESQEHEDGGVSEESGRGSDPLGSCD
jgi:hypothetical protein